MSYPICTVYSCFGRRRRPSHLSTRLKKRLLTMYCNWSIPSSSFLLSHPSGITCWSDYAAPSSRQLSLAWPSATAPRLLISRRCFGETIPSFFFLDLDGCVTVLYCKMAGLCKAVSTLYDQLDLSLQQGFLIASQTPASVLKIERKLTIVFNMVNNEQLVYTNTASWNGIIRPIIGRPYSKNNVAAGLCNSNNVSVL